MKKIFTLNSVYIIAIIASLFILIIPSFSPTIRGTGDGFAHKFRTASFIKSLHEGNIRPRWLADQAIGYGTPTLIYNFSIPYYAVAGIDVFVNSVEKSSQLYEAIIILFTFVSMYLFAHKLYGERIGLLTALAYVGAPQFLHQIYGWEGWGQINAYLFPPLILYEALLLKEKVTLKRALFFVITWVLFINTHNVSALLAVPPLALILFVLMGKSLRRLFFITKLFVGAGIITSFFWLPSIVLSNLIKYKDLVLYHASIRHYELAKIQDYITMSLQTLAEGKTNFYSGSPGLVLLMTIAISLLLFLIILFKKIVNHKNTKDRELLYAATLFLFAFVSLLMTTDISFPIWKTGIFDFFLLYPSRFMFVLTFTGTLLFGWVIKKITNIWSLLILCILIVLLGRPFTNLETTRFAFSDHYFEDNVQPFDYAPGTFMYMATKDFLPIWMDSDFIEKQQNKYVQTNKLPAKIEIPPDQGTVVSDHLSSEYMRFHLLMKTDADVVLNTSYYPDWTASVNGVSVPVGHDVYGRIRVHVPKGESFLSVTFGYSAIERWGFVLSFLGLVYLFMLLRHVRQ